MTIRQRIFAGLLALALAAAGAGVVWAHPSLVRSQPPNNSTLDTAPSQVSVWFDETIEPDYANLSVFDAQSRRVDRFDTQFVPGVEPGLTASLPDLPQGSYIVVWRVISQGDGHAVGGAFSFGVGVPPDVAGAAAAGAEADRQPDLTTNLIRFLGLLSQLVFLGAVVFRSLVWQPAVSRLGSAAGLQREQRRFVQVLGDVLVGALVMGVLGALYAQARATDVLFWELFGTRWGLIWLARAGLSLLLALWMEPLLLGRRPAWQGWALGLALLLATTLSSHSSARPGVLGPLADLGHQFGAAVWLGGLLMLGLSWLTAARSPLAPGERAQLLGEWVTRFSGLASASVGLLLATGLALSLQQVQSWAGLMLTPYGQALLVKLAIVAAALLFGAYNSLGSRRWRLPQAPGASTRRAAWLAAESAAIVAVIFLAAVLTDLPPATAARAERDEPALALAAKSGGLVITGRLQPARLGASVYELSVTGADGQQPVTGATAELFFQPVGGGALSSTLPLEEVPGTPGLYRGTGSGLTRRGPWQILLTLTPPGEAAVYANFDLQVSLDDVVRLAGSPLPLTVRAVDWLNQYGRALLSLAALCLAAGWTWVVRRAVPGLQPAGWLTTGLMLAALVWASLIALTT